MTDRYHALTVTLERDIRSDDAQGLIEAIRWLRGVADVRPEVASIDHHVASVRVRQEYQARILDLFREGPDA
jgi:hypothetical protein